VLSLSSARIGKKTVIQVQCFPSNELTYY